MADVRALPPAAVVADCDVCDLHAVIEKVKLSNGDVFTTVELRDSWPLHAGYALTHCGEIKNLNKQTNLKF